MASLEGFEDLVSLVYKSTEAHDRGLRDNLLYLGMLERDHCKCGSDGQSRLGKKRLLDIMDAIPEFGNDMGKYLLRTGANQWECVDCEELSDVVLPPCLCPRFLEECEAPDCVSAYEGQVQCWKCGESDSLTPQ